jgi:hypothetical protein
MLQTSCEIRGLLYKLKYTRINTKKENYLKAFFFLENAFGFSYIIREGKIVLFDPSFADQIRKDAIIKAISEDAQNSYIKFRRPGI